MDLDPAHAEKLNFCIARANATGCHGFWRNKFVPSTQQPQACLLVAPNELLTRILERVHFGNMASLFDSSVLKFDGSQCAIRTVASYCQRRIHDSAWDTRFTIQPKRHDRSTVGEWVRTANERQLYRNDVPTPCITLNSTSQRKPNFI